MSLQDDIFDVAAALKRKPELKQFERLMFNMTTVEQEAEESRRLLANIRNGLMALKEIAK